MQQRSAARLPLPPPLSDSRLTSSQLSLAFCFSLLPDGHLLVLQFASAWFPHLAEVDYNYHSVGPRQWRFQNSSAKKHHSQLRYDKNSTDPFSVHNNRPPMHILGRSRCIESNSSSN